MKIENFSLKDVLEKCVSCFLVYPFYGSIHYTFIYIYIYIYIYDSQIVYDKPCFNLFILHINSFDNQISKINKNDIFFFMF